MADFFQMVLSLQTGLIIDTTSGTGTEAGGTEEVPNSTSLETMDTDHQALAALLDGHQENGSSSIFFMEGCSCFEWPKVAALIKETFPQLSAGEISYQLRHYKSNFLLAYDGNEVIGCLVYRPNPDPQKSQIAWFDWLAVKKNYRGRKIGENLMNRLMAIVGAKGYLGIQFRAVEKNREATELYKKIDCKLLSRDVDEQGTAWLTYGKDLEPHENVAPPHWKKERRWSFPIIFWWFLYKLFDTRAV